MGEGERMEGVVVVLVVGGTKVSYFREVKEWKQWGEKNSSRGD